MTALKNVWNYFPVANHRIIDKRFETQFKGCDRKLDSACLAANLVCHLTGLAETFYFSLEPETRKTFDHLTKAFKELFLSDDLKCRYVTTVTHFETTGSP